MKKSLLAAVIVAAGSALVTVSAEPANAAPLPCGFGKQDGYAYYTNCSNFNAGIRIVHSNGSLTTGCVLSYISVYIGLASDITNAYTYRTCDNPCNPCSAGAAGASSYLYTTADSRRRTAELGTPNGTVGV
jgi:hypothetical protein